MRRERLGSEIIRLALPATIENIFQTLVSTFSTLLFIFLSHIITSHVQAHQIHFFQ